MIRNVGGCEALTPGHKSQRARGRLGWVSAPSAKKTPWILLALTPRRPAALLSGHLTGPWRDPHCGPDLLPRESVTQEEFLSPGRAFGSQ